VIERDGATIAATIAPIAKSSNSVNGSICAHFLLGRYPMQWANGRSVRGTRQ